MLGEEELAGHLGPHPRPICGRQRRVGRQAGRRVDRRDASGHLEPERADVAIDDLERRPQPGHFLEVASGEVRSFQLLLAQLGQRVQTAAEQALASARRSPGRRRSGRRSRPCRNRSTPQASHPVRCSTTPARCDLSRSRPTPRPAGSDSHTRIPAVSLWMLIVTPT